MCVGGGGKKALIFHYFYAYIRFNKYHISIMRGQICITLDVSEITPHCTPRLFSWLALFQNINMYCFSPCKTFCFTCYK